MGEKEDTKFVEEEKREIARWRAQKLKARIEDYLEARDKIPTGFTQAEKIAKRKKNILDLLGGTERDWEDWKWQIKNRIKDVSVLKKILQLTKQEISEIEKVGSQFRWAISPYYLSLIEPGNPKDPVRLQAVPMLKEIEDVTGAADPMAEEFTSPASCITRRYPDRLIINVTNKCAMYCRHCQRRRNIGEIDRSKSQKDLEEALNYIRKSPEIRDVLLTGGDALILEEDKLDWLLTELDNIPHVEIKRIGSRTPVTLPQRITEELCDMLSRHAPLYLNTQFNHPQEITPDAQKACERLSKAGIPLGNQAVLLKGINNDPHVMKKLNHELLKIRVRPYYIFHAKNVIGTSHFITKVEEGIEIMEKLRGYTSGLAIPTYIINAPQGYGKTPIFPDYLISSGKDRIKIRTWEGRVIDYPNGNFEENEANNGENQS